MDSRSKIFIIVMSILLVPLISTGLYAQYTFDVKTQIEEKDQLQNYKQGLLTAISNSGWASVKEVGEDYSLWLYNLEREHLGDSAIVSLIVELRTAAMFTSGDFIGNRKVWLKYHWNDAEKLAKKEFEEFSYEEENISYEESLQNMGETIGLVSSLGMMDMTGLSNKSISLLVTELGASFKRTPSSLEVLETVYLGEQALSAVKSIISE